MDTPDNAALIRHFYDSFGRRDAEAMAACYTDDVRFSDPVFGPLDGERARGMWRMLSGRAADLEIVASDVAAEGDTGRAHWRATYTFSATGRRVVNEIDARFRFRDGRIAEHHDTFDLHRWSTQALGPTGWLLGWAGPFQRKLRAQALAGLDKFMAKG